MKELHLIDRGYNSIYLLVDGEQTEFKIPKELTVKEVEEILELQSKLQQLSQEEVTDKEKQITVFWDNVFALLLILFRHYQKQITEDFLRTHLSSKDALDIIGFFEENRYLKSKESETSKKKIPKYQLRDLRRQQLFLIKNGFTLSELRQMYIDEYITYYNELIYNLEMVGEVKEGTYLEMTKEDNSGEVLENLYNQIKYGK